MRDLFFVEKIDLKFPVFFSFFSDFYKTKILVSKKNHKKKK